MKFTSAFILTVFLSISSYGQCFPDRHSTSNSTGWLSCIKTPNPNSDRGLSHWILYDLGQVHEIKESHFWNINDPQGIDQGIQEVVLDISVDGVSWWEWGTFTLDQSDGSAFYEGTSGPDFSGTNARYLLFTPLSNYGGNCYGFSELRIDVGEELISSTSEVLDIQMQIAPNPADDRTVVRFDSDLSGEGIIQLVDNIGRIVYRQDVRLSPGLEIELNTSSYMPGLYQLSLLIDNKVQTLELSIKH